MSFIFAIFLSFQAGATISKISGKSLILQDFAEQKYLVVISHGSHCPIFQKSVPKIKRLINKFSPQGVGFLLVNSQLQDDIQSIKEEMNLFALNVKVVKDVNQKFAKEVGFTTTTQVVLVELSSKKVLYLGAIDDQLNYDGQKIKPLKSYLADAIEASLSGQAIKVSRTRPFGCHITFQ